MQKTIENGTTVLHAEEGMILTDNSSFGATVRLGKEDDGSKWYEITDEEMTAIEQAQMEVAGITQEV